MKFVPVQIRGGASDGQSVLFSVYETRVKDFRAFVEGTGYDAKTDEEGKRMKENWESPTFSQTGDHPVVYLSWHAAQAFCNWLTERERKAGSITADQRYRLPTDHEWSCAVGIGGRENAASSPESKDGQIDAVYPWGSEWPPGKVVGNYLGKECYANCETPDDGFQRTAPVGSFPESSSGLHDLGGNASEWCEDWWNPEREYRVMRGGGMNHSNSGFLLSSYRHRAPSSRNRFSSGFRCVLGR